MAQSKLTDWQWQAWDYFLRRCYFVGFAVVAMATIGLAVLAEPLAQYISDQDSLRLQEQKVADLVELQRQQGQLLANSNHPAVVERVAIHHLKYQSAQAARSESLSLTGSWQDLDNAVDDMVLVSQDEAKTQIPGQWFILALADQPKSQWLLFALGSTLVVISMIFFCTPKPSFSQKTP